MKILETFCGDCDSLHHVLPIAFVYTRGFQFDMIATVSKKWRQIPNRSELSVGLRLQRRSADRHGVCRRAPGALKSSRTRKPLCTLRPLTAPGRLSQYSPRVRSYGRALSQRKVRDPNRVDQSCSCRATQSIWATPAPWGTIPPVAWRIIEKVKVSGRLMTEPKRFLLQDLWSFGPLSSRYFYSYVSNPLISITKPHEGNQPLVSKLNAELFSSHPWMAELWKLGAFLRFFRAQIEARWISMAVNKFAHALSRTWDTGGIRAPLNFWSIQYREVISWAM